MTDPTARNLVSQLSALEPGKLPLDVFIEVTRLTVTPIIEIVPLRQTSVGKLEVLLTKREANDPTWPGMLHTPGTVVRATDSEGSFNDAFRRILDGELDSVGTESAPIFVETRLHKTRRGMELAQVFYVEITGTPTKGAFYPCDALPANLVDSQREFIASAVESYIKHAGSK